jgi:hypothetical protein
MSISIPVLSKSYTPFPAESLTGNTILHNDQSPDDVETGGFSIKPTPFALGLYLGFGGGPGTSDMHRHIDRSEEFSIKNSTGYRGPLIGVFSDIFIFNFLSLHGFAEAACMINTVTVSENGGDSDTYYWFTYLELGIMPGIYFRIKEMPVSLNLGPVYKKYNFEKYHAAGTGYRLRVAVGNPSGLRIFFNFDNSYARDKKWDNFKLGSKTFMLGAEYAFLSL